MHGLSQFEPQHRGSLLAAGIITILFEACLASFFGFVEEGNGLLCLPVS
jgi:hypothetical protein